MVSKTLKWVALACVMSASAALSQTNELAGGWSLDGETSELNFLSVKKGKVMEVSRFASLEGEIAEDGTARLEVLTESVDTSVDLRNVRMRFLFFESFKFPRATVTTRITPEMIANLERSQFETVKLPVELSLRGVQRPLEAEVLVHLADTNRVIVSSAKPIVIKLEDFGLLPGMQKLEEAAEVTISPVTSVTFTLAFARNNPQEERLFLASNTRAALEPEGTFSPAACIGRFEILSRTGNISFEYDSAALKADSDPLLREVALILSKCPNMLVEIGGHTDDLGGAPYNEYLSQQRSRSVVNALSSLGVDRSRLVPRGYGETRPIASNATEDGRQRNRRIEFLVIDRLASNG